MTSKAHKTQENSLLSITSLLQRIQLMNRNRRDVQGNRPRDVMPLLGAPPFQ